MLKNLINNHHPKQQTPAMSPSHTYTVGPAPPVPDEDDDNDICPVCDGECTCHNRPHNLQQPARNAVSTTASASSAQPASLKIKLTLPPSMLAKATGKQQLPKFKKYKNPSHEATTVDSGPSTSVVPAPNGSSAPKRRGRPPKAARANLIANRDIQYNGNAAATLPQSESPSPRAQKGKTIRAGPKSKAKPAATNIKNNKGKGTTVKKTAAATKRKSAVMLSEGEEDIDDEEDDAHSVQFPTFVSASAMSSTSSAASDSDALSTLDSDSSLEAEEESYILAEERRVHDRARVRRELLGSDDSQRSKRDPHSPWVIRPRKKSVGPSDVEMDLDSDATEDEDEDEEEEEEEQNEDDEEADEQGPGVGYAGVATGWSEDEESSFDADLFFANLSDSTAAGKDGDPSSSSSDEGEDGYQTDVETMSVTDGPPVFEVSQGWDGQIVFTNGLREGHGVLDRAFEASASAAQLLAEDSATPSHDSDIEMAGSEGGMDDDDDDVSLHESDGETTEDELVGEDGLPTQRAMRLFRWPTSVSAINPLSTVSPGASPGPRTRQRSGTQDSPNPADILAGRGVAFWDGDSDEHDHDEPKHERILSSSARRGDGRPAMGQFEPSVEQRRAVIDGSTHDVPSPYPSRLHRNRSDSHSGLSELGRRGRRLSRASSVPGSASLQSSEELLSQTSPGLPPADPIDLDDVLDASFLDSEPLYDPGMSSTSSEAESRRHLQSLTRWDRIPMGTFRRTTGESAQIPPEGAGIMKTSPFSAMMYSKRPGAGARSSSSSLRKSVVISPVLLPMRDGDRTPTNNATSSTGTPNQPQKTRKEARREKKMKRKSMGKSYGPLHHQHQHHQPHQHHHFHQHHPNMKSRTTSAMQRTNFFSTAAGVPPPLSL